MMNSFGIPTGDLDSLSNEQFENSCQNNQDQIKLALESISNFKSATAQNPSKPRSTSPRRRFTTLRRQRNPPMETNQNGLTGKKTSNHSMYAEEILNEIEKAINKTLTG